MYYFCIIVVRLKQGVIVNKLKKKKKGLLMYALIFKMTSALAIVKVFPSDMKKSITIQLSMW